MDNFDLRQGDCLEVMKDIPAGSIDMILADLPYGTTECKWDKTIALEPLWVEYRRLIKHNGVICLFGSEPFSSRLRMSAIDLYKYDWIWHKNTTTGFQHAKNMPLKDYEIISVFSPGSMGHKSLLGDRRMPYNPQGIVPIYKLRTDGKTRFSGTAGKRPSHKDTTVQTAKNYPRMTLQFNKEAKVIHPTQKPVALLEYLIQTYTSENETVLDNCMGGGSTGVACLHTNRRFIGIEIDEDYFAQATARIANEAVQPV